MNRAAVGAALRRIELRQVRADLEAERAKSQELENKLAQALGMSCYLPLTVRFTKLT